MNKYLKHQLEGYLKNRAILCDVDITKGKNYADYASNVILKNRLNPHIFDGFTDPIIDYIHIENNYVNIHIQNKINKVKGEVKKEVSRMYQLYHRLDIENYHEGVVPEDWYPLVKLYHLMKAEYDMFSTMTYETLDTLFKSLDRGCIYRKYSKEALGGLYQLFHNCLLLKESSS